MVLWWQQNNKGRNGLKLNLNLFMHNCCEISIKCYRELRRSWSMISFEPYCILSIFHENRNFLWLSRFSFPKQQSSKTHFHRQHLSTQSPSNKQSNITSLLPMTLQNVIVITWSAFGQTQGVATFWMEEGHNIQLFHLPF